MAALILGSAALASRFLGLVRDRILAGTFGAGEELDIYFAAFRVPDFVYSIIIAGAISSAFIPVFISHLTRDKQDAWEVARSFFYTTFLTLLIAVAVLFIFMPALIPLVAPGFDKDAQSLAVLMSRIMLISPFFLGLSAVFSGVLHSLRKFFVYSLAPIFYNIGIIVGAIWFTPLWGLQGLAWGVALGAVLHALVQAPVSIHSGFRFTPVTFWHPATGRIVRLMGPRTFGLAAHQINLWVITAIATTLSAGSLAVFTLANNIQYLPVGIIGVSFATAVFPSLSESVSQKQYRQYLKEFSQTLRAVLFIVLPLSILFFVLRAHIVRIVLGSGQFGWEDTRLTAAALGVFSIGIFAYALMPIVARAFYAQENTRTPVLANTLGVVVNIVMSILLIYVIFPRDGFLAAVGSLLKVSDLPAIAVLGLPVAFSFSGILALTVLLIAFFKDKKNGSIAGEVIFAFVRIFVLSVITGVVAWTLLRFFVQFSALEERIEDLTLLRIFLQAAWAGIGAGLFYFATAHILRFDEMVILVSVVKKKFLRRRLLTSPSVGGSAGGPSHPDNLNGLA